MEWAARDVVLSLSLEMFMERLEVALSALLWVTQQ